MPQRMWKLGRVLVLVGYILPLLWIGWVLQPGDGSFASGLLVIFSLTAVAWVSIASLISGSVAAAIAYRQGADIRTTAACLVIGAGIVGAVAVIGALFQLN
jgi:hypothetical protein